MMESTKSGSEMVSSPPVPAPALGGVGLEQRCQQLEAELEYMSGVMEVMR